MFLGNDYPCLIKPRAYIGNPVRLRNRPKIYGVSEHVEGHPFAMEYLFHHMFLAPEQTVRCTLLMLPNPTYPFLESQ